MNKVHGFSWIEVVTSVAILGAVLIVSFLAIRPAERVSEYRNEMMSREMGEFMNEIYLWSQRDGEGFRNFLELAIGEPLVLNAFGKGCDGKVFDDYQDIFNGLPIKYSQGFEFGVRGERVFLRSCADNNGFNEQGEIELSLDLFR